MQVIALILSLMMMASPSSLSQQPSISGSIEA